MKGLSWEFQRLLFFDEIKNKKKDIYENECLSQIGIKIKLTSKSKSKKSIITMSYLVLRQIYRKY